MKRAFYIGDRRCNVELKKVGYFWVVTVDGIIYKKTANELFAVQTFNAI